MVHSKGALKGHIQRDIAQAGRFLAEDDAPVPISNQELRKAAPAAGIRMILYRRLRPSVPSFLSGTKCAKGDCEKFGSCDITTSQTKLR